MLEKTGHTTPPGAGMFIQRAIRCWAFLWVVTFATEAAAQADFLANCSPKANQMIDQGWSAQPMDRSPKNTADPRTAEALYRRALEDSPRCRGALLRLGDLLSRDGDWQQADRFFDLVLKYYPNDPLALRSKADVLRALKKDYAGALRMFIKLLETQGPGNGSLHYDIAATYSMMNRIDDSLEALRRAMAINQGWGDSGNAQRSGYFENLRKDNRFWVMVGKR